LRVLIVSHYFRPHVGGIEVVVEQQAADLAARGHDVTVVTSRHDRRSPRWERDSGGYTIIREPAVNVIEDRLGVPYPLCSPRSLGRLVQLAANHDAVHVHDVFYPITQLGAGAAVLAQRPLFVTQHVAVVDHPNRAVRLAQRLVYATTGRALYGRASCVVLYNNIVRRHLLGLGVEERRLVQVYSGIDVDYFTPADPSTKRQLRAAWGVPPDRAVALFVGRLVAKKGIGTLIRAASPEYLLLVAGPGELPTATLPGEVRHLGELPRAQLRDLYRLSDVFALPAVGEVFTLVMQEAMACGLPVVTTDDPGYEGSGLDRGLIALVPSDALQVRRELLRITGDLELRHRMSAYSRQLAEERFSWVVNNRIAMASCYGG